MMNAEGSRQIKWESWSIELISPILRDTGLHTALNIETYPEKCLLYITTKHLWWQYPRIWFFSSPLLLRLAFNNLKDATARTVFIPAWIFVIMLHSWFSSSLNRFVCVCLGMILRRKIWSNCCKLLLLVSVNHRLFCLLCFFSSFCCAFPCSPRMITTEYTKHISVLISMDSFNWMCVKTKILSEHIWNNDKPKFSVDVSFRQTSTCW